MNTKKAKGRPPKKPAEFMFFGIKCTKKERAEVWEQIGQHGIDIGGRPTVSDFFLKKIGIR
jgi:hypothetical protein